MYRSAVNYLSLYLSSPLALETGLKLDPSTIGAPNTYTLLSLEAQQQSGAINNYATLP